MPFLLIMLLQRFFIYPLVDMEAMILLAGHSLDMVNILFALLTTWHVRHNSWQLVVRMDLVNVQIDPEKKDFGKQSGMSRHLTR